MGTSTLFPTLLAAGAMTLAFGSVQRLSTEQPLSYRVYALDSAGRVLDSADISESGEYRFTRLGNGEYKFMVTATGTDTITLAGIEHKPGAVYRLHQLPTPVTAYKTDTSGLAVSGRGITTDLPYTRELRTPVKLSARGSRADGNGTYIDGMRVVSISSEERSPSPAMESDRRPARPSYAKAEDASHMSVSDPVGGSGSSDIAPGQITAGYWRDLDNWEEWLKNQKNENVHKWQSVWGFYPDRSRFGVEIHDKNGQPLIGAVVKLISAPGGLQWQAVTDNEGRADLFHLLNADMRPEVLHSFELRVISGKDSAVFGKISPGGSGREIYRVPFGAEVTPVADIAFVVDATGSMGDEIRYLQSELTDVISRVRRSQSCVSIRTGSVFYRDHGDAYVTRISQFSDDPLNTVSFIHEQAAGGGGDFPEAVDAAMEASVESLNWSSTALAKVMFLVLDAPPHQDGTSREKMQKYTRMAAAKGIAIIPVVASGIDQSTEFLMKYLSIATGGAYVYITDHSGIGGSHLKPTGVKENKNYLNELLVNIISERLKWKGCRNDSAAQNQGKTELLTQGQWQVQVYPNPSVGELFVKSNETPDRIEIWTMAGVKVLTREQNTLKNRIDLGQMTPGMYIIRIIRKEQMLSCRILVMR